MQYRVYLTACAEAAPGCTCPVQPCSLQTLLPTLGAMPRRHPSLSPAGPYPCDRNVSPFRASLWKKCPTSSSFQVTLASVFAGKMQCSFNYMHFCRGQPHRALKNKVPALGEKIAIGAKAMLGARKSTVTELHNLNRAAPWTLQVGTGTPQNHENMDQARGCGHAMEDHTTLGLWSAEARHVLRGGRNSHEDIFGGPGHMHFF